MVFTASGSVQLSCHCTFNYFNESITNSSYCVVFFHAASRVARSHADDDEYWTIVLPVTISTMPPRRRRRLNSSLMHSLVSAGGLQWLNDELWPSQTPRRRRHHLSASQLTRNGTMD